MIRSRAGFTLLELIIVMSILAVIMVKLTIVIDEASRTQRRESSSMALEDKAWRLLDQIAFQVIAADRETVTPLTNSSSLFDDRVQYEVSLGVENGETVWSPPEAIGLGDNESEVFWAQSFEQPEEQTVIWSRDVAELFGAEVLNGLDENGNNLQDETGLAFTLEGNRISIRLTLEEIDENGNAVRATVETSVTCRN